MKLLAFIFEQPSYIKNRIDNNLKEDNHTLSADFAHGVKHTACCIIFVIK